MDDHPFDRAPEADAAVVSFAPQDEAEIRAFVEDVARFDALRERLASRLRRPVASTEMVRLLLEVAKRNRSDVSLLARAWGLTSPLSEEDVFALLVAVAEAHFEALVRRCR